MTKTKKLGIWMDHSNAHLIEYSKNAIKVNGVVSKLSHEGKDGDLERSEKHVHFREQSDQAAYYKELGAVIKKYDEVIIFGPTDAKKELFKILQKDNGFKGINIAIQQTDKMTDNQEHAFVKTFFSEA